MKRAVICLIILTLVSTLASKEAGAHKFYASFVTMNFNQQEHLVEITMRIFPDDLAAALRKQQNKNVQLDKSKEVTAMIMVYLRKTFELKKGGRVQPLQWVGMELGVDSAFLYFEVKMPGGLSGVQLRDHFLFEMFDDQTNVVSIKYNGKQLDHVFRRNESEAFKLIP
jgi:hypothetical protein